MSLQKTDNKPSAKRPLTDSSVFNFKSVAVYFDRRIIVLTQCEDPREINAICTISVFLSCAQTGAKRRLF
jgi:hypothetical protein